MNDVLVYMMLVEWAAKNLHYGAEGHGFYGLHLLADKIDFGTSADDLKEAYYLGFKNELPPTMAELAQTALERSKNASEGSDDTLIGSLLQACEDCLYAVEEAKREPGLPAGIHAIVDGVSQTMLTIKGLCWRVIHAKENKEDGNED